MGSERDRMQGVGGRPDRPRRSEKARGPGRSGRPFLSLDSEREGEGEGEGGGEGEGETMDGQRTIGGTPGPSLSLSEMERMGTCAAAGSLSIVPCQLVLAGRWLSPIDSPLGAGPLRAPSENGTRAEKELGQVSEKKRMGWWVGGERVE
jgi:hypothetical protein